MGGLPVNAGDTAFVLIRAALVALMTPALAFFYGGMVRRKDFLAIMMQSFIVGLLAGSICFFAVIFKEKMQWDDALDVWAAHGVGGTLGIILVGVFALRSVNPAIAVGREGLITGQWHLFTWQIITAVVIGAYSFVATWAILKTINLFGSVRVPDSVELKGLDEAEFGETAYNLT